MRLTLVSARIIGVFTSDPAIPRYGLELSHLTGIATGTLYPVLARFETAGWLTSSREDINPADTYRPARRLYTITEEALPAARTALAAISSDLGAPTIKEPWADVITGGKNLENTAVPPEHGLPRAAAPGDSQQHGTEGTGNDAQ